MCSTPVSPVINLENVVNLTALNLNAVNLNAENLITVDLNATNLNAGNLEYVNADQMINSYNVNTVNTVVNTNDINECVRGKCLSADAPSFFPYVTSTSHNTNYCRCGNLRFLLPRLLAQRCLYPRLNMFTLPGNLTINAVVSRS